MFASRWSLRPAALCAITCFSLSACGAEERQGQPGSPNTADSAIPVGDAALPVGDATTNAPDPIPDAHVAPDAVCSAIGVQARASLAPVDVVWVVDNSDSMRNEADLIQVNLNAFANSIEETGIDVHMVMITGSGFVIIPPPLGVDAERFLPIAADVSSHAALGALVSQYVTYQSFLRPDSSLHFVAVSDDNSNMDGDEFVTTMSGALDRPFTFHSIVSPPGSTQMPIPGFVRPGCSGPHGFAAFNGDAYWHASEATGGSRFSICTEDWSALFDTLSAAVGIPTPLPCAFDLPRPPAGLVFDPTRINVDYTPGDQTEVERVPSVGTPERCGDGWFYESVSGRHERILLCPSTCSRLEADDRGRVDIAFGCLTELI